MTFFEKFFFVRLSFLPTFACTAGNLCYLPLTYANGYPLNSYMEFTAKTGQPGKNQSGLNSWGRDYQEWKTRKGQRGKETRTEKYWKDSFDRKARSGQLEKEQLGRTATIGGTGTDCEGQETRKRQSGKENRREKSIKDSLSLEKELLARTATIGWSGKDFRTGQQPGQDSLEKTEQNKRDIVLWKFDKIQYWKLSYR